MSPSESLTEGDVAVIIMSGPLDWNMKGSKRRLSQVVVSGAVSWPGWRSDRWKLSAMVACRLQTTILQCSVCLPVAKPKVLKVFIILNLSYGLKLTSRKLFFTVHEECLRNLWNYCYQPDAVISVDKINLWFADSSFIGKIPCNYVEVG